MSYQLLPRDGSPIPHPITTSAGPTTSRRGRALAFFGTAAATGILFHLLLLGFGPASPPSSNSASGTSVKDWWGTSDPLDMPPKPPVYSDDPATDKTCTPSSLDSFNVSTSYIRPGFGQYVVADEDEWTMDKIRTMVEGTRGYYARDYSLGLGWNNMRYIVETGLLHAHLLNRTLVLPSFVYARACEWNITVCASYADMVNRGDAIGWGEWRELPIEQQMGWRVPIEIMLDIRHLRKYVPVVTIAEYLTLHNLDPSLEWSNGAWQREAYHSSTPSPSLGVIANSDYDPPGVVRVEKMPPPSAKEITTGPVYKALMDAKGNDLALKMTDVKNKLEGIASWNTDEELEQIIEDHGFVVLHTFAGALGMDYLKSVIEPIKQVAPRAALRGFIDDYAHLDQEVVLIEGETHLYRKPGSLRFTSKDVRRTFQDIVLHGSIHIPPIEMLADRVALRMLKLNDGRMWMAGHMRRGDFVRLSWAMENTVEKHFERIKSRLHTGAAVLKQVAGTKGPYHTNDIPNVKPDETFLGKEPPREDDKFYIATDERSPEGLKYIREHGAVMIGDLLYPEDRRIVGWPLLLTDVLALLEQSVMAHAAYFYAHAMSSVAGGVVNMRGARGIDPRFTLID